MKNNLFDPAIQQATLERLQRLSPDTTRQWGKMTPNETLCHLADPFRDVLQLRATKPVVPRIFQPLVRMMLITEKDWAPNSPTLKPYRQGQGGGGTPPTNFEADKATLINLVGQFCATAPDYKFGEHAGVGRPRRDQLGIFMWKHLDHHLRQFGL